MKPNAEEYCPDPEYITSLILSTGMTQPQLAKTLGCTDRAIRHWMAGSKQYPYTVQFALEALVLEPD